MNEGREDGDLPGIPPRAGNSHTCVRRCHKKIVVRKGGENPLRSESRLISHGRQWEREATREGGWWPLPDDPEEEEEKKIS